MLYYLIDYLEQLYQPPGFQAIRFINNRAALAAITALIISLYAGRHIIAWLRKRQIGEQVREGARAGAVDHSPLLHRVGSPPVQAIRVARVDLGQIRTDVIEVELQGRGLQVEIHHAGLDQHEHVLRADRIARCDRELTHRAALFRVDHGFHLHGFHDQQRLTRAHFVTLAHAHAHDRPERRRAHGDQAFRHRWPRGRDDRLRQ